MTALTTILPSPQPTNPTPTPTIATIEVPPPPPSSIITSKIATARNEKEDDGHHNNNMVLMIDKKKNGINNTTTTATAAADASSSNNNNNHQKKESVAQQQHAAVLCQPIHNIGSVPTPASFVSSASLASKTPIIECNNRAKSRKIRVYQFYDFIKLHFSQFFHNVENDDDDNNTNNNTNTDTDTDTNYNSDNQKKIILDVAGGKGDLSWIICNLHSQLQSIIIDPRFFQGDYITTATTATISSSTSTTSSSKPMIIPKHRHIIASTQKLQLLNSSNHKSILKTIQFLQTYPEVIPKRNQRGTLTYQPLAELLPALLQCQLERRQRQQEYANANANANANDGCFNDVEEEEEWISPKCMKIYFDNTLVTTLNKTQMNQHQSSGTMMIDTSKHHDNESLWIQYWKQASCKAIGHHHHQQQQQQQQQLQQLQQLQQQQQQQIKQGIKKQIIQNPHEGHHYLSHCSLILGFHPDQATEAIIDYALLYKVPFCIVPCCVFPNEFPNRFFDDKSSKEAEEQVFVRDYDTFIKYLKAKDERIRNDVLNIHFTETAKKIVLYMLPEDFE